MGGLRKESEAKWITARHWSSPDTWPPFLGSWVASCSGRAGGGRGWKGMDGWIDVWKRRYAVPKPGLPWERRPARADYGAILRSKHDTDLQGPGGAAGNLPRRRWGAGSQKVCARSVSHIWCFHPSPPTEGVDLLASDVIKSPSWVQRCRYKALCDLAPAETGCNLHLSCVAVSGFRMKLGILSC